MPPPDPRNIFEVNLTAIPNQIFHLTFNPACPGPVRVDIRLSPLGTQGHSESTSTTARTSEPVAAVSPPRLRENTSTPTHFSAAVSPPHLENSIPTHVSVAVSPFRLGLGDSSIPQRVSRAISPIPIRIFDLLPPDFPFSDLSDDSEENDMIYKTPGPPLSESTRVIAPDLKLESEEIQPFKARVRSQETEIISETEPESVTEPESD